MVVFSNAVVFQPTGNFFKQMPGTNFVWNEVRLTLSPEFDYRLAEKRLLEAVDEVSRYRDSVLRHYRHLDLASTSCSMLKPQIRLHSPPRAGLEIVTSLSRGDYSAPQTTDEVSRRVLDAIAREPGLRLVAAGTANIESEKVPTACDSQQRKRRRDRATDRRCARRRHGWGKSRSAPRPA